jgi:hypothetical protein
MYDLKQEIRQWQENGEQIILCGDFNTGDKNTPSAAQQFWNSWIDDLSLIDAHKSRTGLQWLPPTHERGSTQIDYIFISPSIQIKRAGFLPFNKFPGDHRAIWIDIQTEDIIGFNPPSLSRAAARRLKSDHPLIRNRYLALLHQYAEVDGIFNKFKHLESISPLDWTDEHTTCYNSTEQLFKTHMETAEKKCRKLHTGQHPFSAAFNKARKIKFFWELVVKDILGLHVPKRKILKLKKALGIKSSKPPLHIAEKKRDNARKQYGIVKRQFKQLRTGFRDQLATSRALENNTKAASEIRNIIHREEIRDMHKKIKWMRGRCKGDSTDSVIITKPSGRQKLITNREALEQSILQENERKYHQTEGQCPLMENFMLDHLGTMATTPAASQIVQGSYKIPSTVGKATRNFLKACQRPKDFKLPEFDHCSKDQYIRAWRKARESTGSGKLHFGHWKSGIKDEQVAHMQWLITFLPGKFSPISWRQATDVMILKKSGVLNIERLRTIVLYEADYNFFNKCVGRQAMDNGIYNNLVAEEQYSKPNSSAQDQCINRRLIFDLVRHTKQAMALASSDLKSCYDRIVHNAASLAMQRVGISQQIIKTMFDTVQKCEHKVRTAYGDSRNTYGPNTGQYKQPVMGVGQGNGAGPQIWSLISSVLFLAMHLDGLSTKFVSKLTSEFIDIIGYMYVDDMDLIQIKPYHQWQTLTETLQLTLAYWNKLVKVTGGALEPSKSGWFAF